MSSQLSYLTFTTRSRHSHLRHPLHPWVHHCVVTPTLPGQLNLRQIWNFNMNWSYTWAKFKMNWTHTWGVFKPQQCNRCCVESQEATRLLASTFAMAMIMIMMMVGIVMVKTPPLTWKVREKQWWWWWDFKIMANAKKYHTWYGMSKNNNLNDPSGNGRTDTKTLQVLRMVSRS